MGDFSTSVSTLLQTFSTGLAIIKRLRRARKETKVKTDSAVKSEEELLSKSLKTSRRGVKSVYDKYTQTKSFAAGDAEAESSLASILFRLNAGFVSIIDRFLKGQSSHSDYRMLVNLSNASRLEAIQTFEQLQHRISQSSLSLGTSLPSKHHRKRRKHNKTSRGSSGHHSAGRSRKSSGDLLKQTYLGPASSSGWVRMKRGKTKRTSSSSIIPTAGPSIKSRGEALSTLTQALLPPPPALPQPKVEHRPSPKLVTQKLSIMSFATASTKIGEIPEHKWGGTLLGAVGIQEYNGARPAFPVRSYQEPEKQYSRLRKLFRRGR